MHEFTFAVGFTAQQSPLSCFFVCVFHFYKAFYTVMMKLSQQNLSKTTVEGLRLVFTMFRT